MITTYHFQHGSHHGYFHQPEILGLLKCYQSDHVNTVQRKWGWGILAECYYLALDIYYLDFFYLFKKMDKKEINKKENK